jgi:hypothetical protein
MPTLYDTLGKDYTPYGSKERTDLATKAGIGTGYVGNATQNEQIVNYLNAQKTAGSGTPTVSDIYGGTTPSVPTPDMTDSADLTEQYNRNNAVNEEQIRQDTLRMFQGQIDATNQMYAQKVTEAKQQGLGALGTGRAIQARSGTLGSDFSEAQNTDINKANEAILSGIQAEQSAKLAEIMGLARTEASSEIAKKNAARKEGLDSYLKFLGEKTEKTKTNKTKLVQSLIDQGFDPAKLDKAWLQGVAEQYGITIDDIKSEYISMKKAQEVAAKDGFSLSEGQSRYDSEGNLIATNAKTGGSAGGLTEYQKFQGGMNLGNKVDKLIQGSKEVVTKARLAQEAYDRFDKGEAGDLNATTQVIITNFNKILDPTSVVRESEYARSPEGQSFIDNLEGRIVRLEQGGAGLTKESLKEFVELGNQFAKKAQSSIEVEKKRATDYADKYGIDTSYVGGGYTNPAGTLQQRVTNAGFDYEGMKADGLSDSDIEAAISEL